MRIKNLSKIYIYKPITKINLGEVNINWSFDSEAYCNIQQDFNELDRNLAGNIDYESIKMRTDQKLNIENGDGISFSKTEIPQYVVKSKPVIGKNTTYTCYTYYGE